MPPDRTVLVINSGSSSLKYQLIEPDSGQSLADGIVERIGEPSSAVADHAAALRMAFDELSEAGIDLNDVRACRGRAPGGARWRNVLPADPDRRRDDRRTQAGLGAGAAAQSACRAGYRGGPQDASGCAACRGVRHGVLPRPARRRGDLRHRSGVGAQVADPPIRIPRHVAPVRQRTGRGVPGQAAGGPESDCAASG